MVIDVGADHGLSSLFLASHNHKVYASEVAKGPFLILKNAVDQHSELKITCLLMDGLKGLPEDVDTALILGMGGKTIHKILCDSKDKLSQLNDIIIEPQSNFEEPIQFLLENAYINDAGTYIFERHYYPILRFTKSATKTNYSKNEIRYGPYPYLHKDENLLKYLDSQLLRLESLESASKKRHEDEIKSLKEVIDDIRKTD